MGRPERKYETRQCVICNKDFETCISNKQGNRKKTCGHQSCTSKLAFLNDKDKYTVTCKICKRVFKHARYNRTYCSDACRKLRILKNCKACNGEFRTDKKETQVCSQKCKTNMIQSNLKSYICTYCHKQNKRASNTLAEGKNAFCSRRCANNYFGHKLFGERSKYTGRWDSTRRKVLKYYDHYCQKCNYKGDIHTLHVHHVVPVKYLDRDNEEQIINTELLLPLCQPCHAEVHRDNKQWYENTFS